MWFVMIRMENMLIFWIVRLQPLLTITPQTGRLISTSSRQTAIRLSRIWERLRTINPVKQMRLCGKNWLIIAFRASILSVLGHRKRFIMGKA